MTSSSDNPSDNPFASFVGMAKAGAANASTAQRPSFAQRVAAEGDRRRPGHENVPPVVPPAGLGRRASDPAGPRQAAAGANPYARFIPREEVGKVAAWQPSAFGGPKRESTVTAAPDPVALQRAAELEAKRQAELAAQRATAEAAARAAELRGARDGGYQDGYRDGLAALEAFKTSYNAQASAQVAAVVQSLHAELGELEQHLAQRVAGIALEVARQVVRSELQVHPETVVAVTQEALASILVSARHVTVRLHPEDHGLVAEGLADVLKSRGARLVADPALVRGGCLVESDIGAVDARVATRWERASAALGRPSAYGQDASHASDAYDQDLPERTSAAPVAGASPVTPVVAKGDQP